MIIGNALRRLCLAAMFTFSVSASWSEAGCTVVIGDSVHFRYDRARITISCRPLPSATYGDRLGTIMSDKVSRDSVGTRMVFHALRMDLHGLRHDVSFRGEHKLAGTVIQHINYSLRSERDRRPRSLDRLTLERHRRDGAAETHFQINGHYWYMISTAPARAG